MNTQATTSSSALYPRGGRLPALGFWTSGVAVSDVSSGYINPFDAVARDIAYSKAQIPNFNEYPYSSVLPQNLNIVDIDSVEYSFSSFGGLGAVLEVIIAEVGIIYSEGPTRGNISVRTHGRDYIMDSDAAVVAAASCVMKCTDVMKDGQNIGGYVCEYVGTFATDVGSNAAQAQANTQLNESMDHLLSIRGIPTSSGNRHIESISYVAVSKDKPYGYTLNGYGFLNFTSAPLVTT